MMTIALGKKSRETCIRGKNMFKRIKKKIKIKFYNGANNMTRFEKIKPMNIDELEEFK